MTTLVPGDQIHILSPITIALGTSLADSMKADVVPVGATVTLTASILDASRDREGRSWILDLVDDEDGQRARWNGKVVFARGAWPADEIPATRDSVEWDEAREAARQAALALTDARERKAALVALERRYGPKRSNQTLAVYAGDQERLQIHLGAV